MVEGRTPCWVKYVPTFSNSSLVEDSFIKNGLMCAVRRIKSIGQTNLSLQANTILGKDPEEKIPPGSVAKGLAITADPVREKD